jgi:predicted RecA/RadA family phage recombinase
MRNFVQDGDTITLTAPYAVASGAGLLVGAVFAVAAAAAALNGAVESKVTGVFDLPKAAGAVTQGQKIYWDNAAKVVTTTVGANTLIGAATQPAAGGDATARVRLNGTVA